MVMSTISSFMQTKMITREMVEKRLEQLTAERDQLVANLQAYNGAIQDCEYWLNQLAEIKE